MNWLYYSCASSDIDNKELDIPDGFILNVIHPRLCSMHDILWTILSFGRYKEYQLLDNRTKQVVAKAQLMPKIIIFGFMKTGGLHIGPCFTEPQYRGNGFYPFLLKKIMQDYQNKVSDFYIFCDEKNISSKKGIEKAGFKCFGKGVKNRWGIYICTSSCLVE